MCRDPLRCIIPSYMLKKLAQSDNRVLRESAREDLQQSKQVRKRRMAALPTKATKLEKAEAASVRKLRLVYSTNSGIMLPGKLLRAEGQGPCGDKAADEAYVYSGHTYDFFWKVLKRSSVDGAGMPLISTVHYFEKYDNAFWDGTQMVYGDGEGIVFNRFTASLDIVAHELTHGVISFTSDLEYDHQPGALNEHFADVFGVLVKLWRKGWTATEALKKDGWLIGKEIVVQAPGRKALRSMSEPGSAYNNDKYLGNDEQPWHMSNFYKGADDEGGVHINSGIPNHAFFVTCMTLGGKPWLRAGRIWYEAMIKLKSRASFQKCAEMTYLKARELYGSKECSAVRKGWKTVGIEF